jgi:hypothetical protein
VSPAETLQGETVDPVEGALVGSATGTIVGFVSDRANGARVGPAEGTVLGPMIGPAEGALIIPRGLFLISGSEETAVVFGHSPLSSLSQQKTLT